MDPWKYAGVLESNNDKLKLIMIKDGAHHLDLRSPNENDPQSVIDARNEEIETIKQWLNEHNNKVSIFE